ncbi:MAG: hypothetical protein ACI4PF_01050 [Christensenellales bacterium]
MEVQGIIKFFSTYGWKLGLLALSGIVVLGFLKKVGTFKKLNPKYKKYVYFGLSAVFSIVACTIYLLATKSFQWIPYLILCGSIFGLTLIVYQIYEHTGLRWLWNKIVDFVCLGIKKFFTLIFVHKVDAKKLEKDMMKFGVDEAIKFGQELQAKIDEEKKKQETDVPNEQVTGN